MRLANGHMMHNWCSNLQCELLTNFVARFDEMH
jgi:hypothetical protein